MIYEREYTDTLRCKWEPMISVLDKDGDCPYNLEELCESIGSYCGIDIDKFEQDIVLSRNILKAFESLDIEIHIVSSPVFVVDGDGKCLLFDEDCDQVTDAKVITIARHVGDIFVMSNITDVYFRYATIEDCKCDICDSIGSSSVIVRMEMVNNK